MIRYHLERLGLYSLMLALGCGVVVGFGLRTLAQNEPAVAVEKYTVTLATSHPEKTRIVKSPAKPTYTLGESVVVRPFIEERFRDRLIFSYWSGDIPSGVSATSSSLSLRMSGNKSIKANFVPAAELIINRYNEANDREELLWSKIYPESSTVNLIARPEIGFQFEGWREGIVTTTTPALSLTLDKNRRLEVRYKRRLSSSPQAGVSYAESAQGTGVQVASSSTPPTLSLPPGVGVIASDATVIPGFAPLLAPFAENDTGDHVRQLQQMLARDGYYRQTSTGIYDDATKEAVALFQQKYGITTNAQTRGFAGPATRAKLNQVYATAASTSTASTSRTLDPAAATEAAQLTTLIEQVKAQIQSLSY